MVMALVIFLSNFVLTHIKGTKREVHLCASLIKQMEATQQAERKSMNKSSALANASHDIRAPLAGITGLVELCYHQANPGSHLRLNLARMSTYTEDLLCKLLFFYKI